MARKGSRSSSKGAQRSGVFREYRFVIDAYSPATFPMGRLAEYLADLSALIGERDRVHFVKLGKGSTAVVHRVEWEAEPKIRERLRSVRHADGPAEAAEAYRSLNRRLEEDNASGRLVAKDGGRVLDFPGAKSRREPIFGPFNQPGEITGVVIGIAGKNDPVNVHIQDGDTVHYCEASKDVAISLRASLFGKPVSVSGTGRWFRNDLGKWEMRSFRIIEYRELDHTPLRETLEEIRKKRLGSPPRIVDFTKIRQG